MLKAACPDPVPQDEHRLRVCSLTGVLGAAIILVGYFLPWVEVRADVAERFDRAVDARIENERIPDFPAEDDWARLADQLVEDGSASGMDIFYWSRTASTCNTSACMPRGEDSQLVYRGIRAARVWLAALPVAAGLLLLYFLSCPCRRAKSPALILAVLTGAASIATVAVHRIVSTAFPEQTSRGTGLVLLLGGGALLFLAGTFGVKARNWWRVLGGAILVGAGLGWGLVRYLDAG